MAKLNRTATTDQRIAIAMQMSGKRQTDLSNETGLNKSTISRYVSGDCEPKADAINKLASALGVNEMWLWGYDVPMERTDFQKKNDQLVKLVTRMRRDERFAEAVKMLDELSDDKFENITQILSAFTQK